MKSVIKNLRKDARHIDRTLSKEYAKGKGFTVGILFNEISLTASIAHCGEYVALHIYEENGDVENCEVLLTHSMISAIDRIEMVANVYYLNHKK